MRDATVQWFHPDGSGRLPQSCPPHREALWLAPALYSGPQESIELANRIIGRWHDGPRRTPSAALHEAHGSDFGIFQSNMIAHLHHRFRERLTPEAETVMRVHLGHAVRRFGGSGQADTSFRGGNDNMPMMATMGLIFAGEALDDERAVQQGLWNLHQFRLLLSRSAWASEFNSSTYSPITLSHAAQLATFARDEEVRDLALRIEQRLWAEVVLHYHPGTFLQAGPQSRAYAVDLAGHTHALQFLFWLVFGPEQSGRDPLRSLVRPDGKEILHFAGCPFSSIAEYVSFIDTDFHVPPELAELFSRRHYPARLRGRTEVANGWQACHTQTYMEEAFSLGTSSAPWANGEQTAPLYATYRRLPQPADFRDSGVVTFKYLTSRAAHGETERSADGAWEGEKFLPNRGWSRTLQKDNTALVSVTPSLDQGEIETDTLRLDVLFPTHYGRISRSIVGDGPVRDGAVGESETVVPVSVETGQVFVHLMPLLPTSLPRRKALRFTSHPGYEALELVNYEGPPRRFTVQEQELALNGFVLTIEPKTRHRSLEAFHRARSQATLVDYSYLRTRCLEFRRDDAWFQLTYQPGAHGAQAEAIDGRTLSRPLMESNQCDVRRLPFLAGSVAPNPLPFPWSDSMEMRQYPGQAWIIGSRGIEGETAYSHLAASPSVG